MLTLINGMARWVGLAVSRFSETAYDAFAHRESLLAVRVVTNGKVSPDSHTVIGSEFSMGYDNRQAGRESDCRLGIRIASRLGECG